MRYKGAAAGRRSVELQMVNIPPQLRRKADQAKNGEQPWATVRRLLQWFGSDDLTTPVIREIDAALHELNLETRPDYLLVESVMTTVVFALRAGARATPGRLRAELSDAARSAFSTASKQSHAVPVKVIRRSRQKFQRAETTEQAKQAKRQINDDPLPDELIAVAIWAAELEAERGQLQYEIDSAGGVAEVLVLLNESGREVAARVINTRHGACWQLLTADGRWTGEFIPFRDVEALKRAGFSVEMVSAPAIAAVICERGEAFPHVEAVVDADRKWRHALLDADDG